MANTDTFPRNSVAVDRTWNAESVFATPDEWEAELVTVLAAIPGFADRAGRVGESAAFLLDTLLARDSLLERIGKVEAYAFMSYAVETTDAEAVARFGKAQAADGQVTAAIAFVEPEVLAIGRERLREWEDREPGLRPFGHHFDDLVRRSAHLRSAEIEELIGLTTDAFGSPFAFYSALVDSDLTFAPVTTADGQEIAVTHGSIDALLGDSDRAVRRAAWESYADGYLSVRSALAAGLSGAIKQAVFTTRVRHYPTALERVLSAPNLPLEVFDNLIAAFEANLPTWHRYWELRSKLAGVERVAPFDVFAPLNVETPAFSYEQCVDWASASLEPLGAEYVETVRRGCLEERWVDVYPTAGKMDGAFSAGSPGMPPFIMMSFDGTAVSLGTLAHELGHSMHSYLTWRTQPRIYSRYATFVAEVASNFHQALLRAYMLRVVDDPAIRLAVLGEAMSNFHRYFFVMPTLARLERELHAQVQAGEGLTADAIGERTLALFGEGFGPAVELDTERVGITWAQFAHLYEPFYVFQYATGISAANALAEGVLAGSEGAVARYLEFLSAGSSVYPLDALLRAGVDMRSPAPVDDAFRVLATLVDQVEALVV